MDNGLILLLLLLLLNKNKENKTFHIPIDKKENDLEIKSIPSSNKSFSLNVPYTLDKIKIAKKIGPYFPEEFVPALNKSLILTEKIIKLYEVMEFMQVDKVKYIENVITVENNKERLNYIVNTIQKEVKKEEIKSTGTIIEMILNIDKYSKMITVLNSVMSDPDSLNDPTKLLSLAEPFMQGRDEKEKEKLKDMAKMLEIMKTLDTTKKPKEKDIKTEN